MRRWLPRVILSLAMAGVTGLIGGCHDDSGKPEAKEAERALGVNPNEQKKTTEVTRDVTEVVEKKVIDNKTGQTISDKVTTTPVRVTEKTEVKKDVEAKVGESKTTGK
jgi:hypothetical protein